MLFVAIVVSPECMYGGDAMKLVQTGICSIGIPIDMEVSSTVQIKPDHENLPRTYTESDKRSYKLRSCGWLGRNVVYAMMVYRIEALDGAGISYEYAKQWVERCYRGIIPKDRPLLWFNDHDTGEWRVSFTSDVDEVDYGKWVRRRMQTYIWLKKHENTMYQLLVQVPEKYIYSKEADDICRKIYESWQVR